MLSQSEKAAQWQQTGGTLTIPNGHFLMRVDCDAEEPYLIMIHDKTNEETRLPIPKALAYYLSTHHCGSNRMHKLIEEHTRRNIANGIKDLLGLE